MRKTSEILTLVAINNDRLIKVSEYAESPYRDIYSKYPFNSDRALKVGSEWSLDLSSKVWTYNGRIYVKFKHHTNEGCVVCWFKTKSKRYTAYNVAKALEVMFI